MDMVRSKIGKIKNIASEMMKTTDGYRRKADDCADLALSRKSHSSWRTKLKDLDREYFREYIYKLLSTVLDFWYSYIFVFFIY